MKILIFGIPGSGKTTFSNHLSRITGIPVFHIDRHFFEKGWKERPKDAFIADVQKQLEKGAWIIDGNGMRTLEMRYKEANFAIYCRLPRWLCCLRIFYRMISTIGREKKDGPEGARNNVSWKLLKYLWNFPTRYDRMITALRKKYPDVSFYCLRSQKEMEQLEQKFKR